MLGELAPRQNLPKFFLGKQNLSKSLVEPWLSPAATNEKLALWCWERLRERHRRSTALRGASADASSKEWKTPLRTGAGPKGARVREQENCGRKANNSMMEILRSASRERSV